MYLKNKKGQGMLFASVVGGAIVSLIVASATSWFLSMNKNINGTNDRLEAMTIAMSEWQRLEHMSLDELEANRENYKTPYNVGDKFSVGINLGEQGFFDNGKCNSLTGDYASESPNCFKDTIMTVYDKDGKSLYTTRSLPLSVGGASIPEGTIWPYTGDLAKIPRGWVLCDGTNGTPDLRGRFLEGTNTNTGEFKEAGLPNIKGRLGSQANFFPSASGAFYVPVERSDDGGYWAGGEVWQYQMSYFDASRSNAIYGKANTVQPKSFTVFYIMKTNKDFHYDHTNGFVSPEYYTKAEVDALISNTKEKIENNVASIYLPMDSNAYVHNDNMNYGLSMAYNSEDKKMHFYVDGVELSVGEMKFPDYTAGIQIPYNQIFIAPSDGLVNIIYDSGCGTKPPHGYHYANTEQNLTLDGVYVSTHGLGCSGENPTPAVYPVKKGTIIKYSAKSAHDYIAYPTMFFPYK